MVSAADLSYICCRMLCLEVVSHHASVLLFVIPSVSVCAEWVLTASASALSRRYCVWKMTTKVQEAKQHNPAITSTGTVCVYVWAETKGENQMSLALSRHIWACNGSFQRGMFPLTHYNSFYSEEEVTMM